MRELQDLPTDEEARDVDEWVAERVGSCDPTRLVQLTRYGVARVRPEALRQRVTRGRDDRTFDVHPGPAGMSEVYASIPSDRAAALWEAANDLAGQYRTDDPTLTMDQARADAFVDLALGGVDVQVRVDLGVAVLPTAHSELGDPTSSAQLVEHGLADPEPEEAAWATEAESTEWERRRDVDADPWYRRPHGTHPGAGDVARAHGPFGAGGAALSGVWLPKVGYVPADVVTRLVSLEGARVGLALLEARTGTLLGTVGDAYRPDARMRHFVAVRDGRCRMFGCQLRAEHWDVDHAVPHPLGSTSPPNLAGLCRRHHRAKQRRGWHYRLRADGVATWRSPQGVERVTYPDHHLLPATAPPPRPGPSSGQTPADGEPPPF